MIKADPILHPGDDRSFMALSANIMGASLTGLPDGFILEATSLGIDINQVTSTAIPM